MIYLLYSKKHKFHAVLCWMLPYSSSIILLIWHIFLCLIFSGAFSFSPEPQLSISFMSDDQNSVNQILQSLSNSSAEDSEHSYDDARSNSSSDSAHMDMDVPRSAAIQRSLSNSSSDSAHMDMDVPRSAAIQRSLSTSSTSSESIESITSEDSYVTMAHMTPEQKAFREKWADILLPSYFDSSNVDLHKKLTLFYEEKDALPHLKRSTFGAPWKPVRCVEPCNLTPAEFLELYKFLPPGWEDVPTGSPMDWTALERALGHKHHLEFYDHPRPFSVQSLDGFNHFPASPAIAPAEIAPAEIAPAEIAPAEVAPAEIASPAKTPAFDKELLDSFNRTLGFFTIIILLLIIFFLAIGIFFLGIVLLYFT